MGDNKGFITLHRKIIDWEWYDDVNTFKLFIHMLLKANHSGKQWRGIEIERGSFVTSISSLASETGLTSQQVRTSIKKLKSTNEITSQTTNRNTLIIVLKYSVYQDYDIDSNKQNNTPNNKQITNKQHSNNKQVTTTNNVNNDNNDNSTLKEKNTKKEKSYFENEELNQTFLDFIEHRKKMKSPMTEIAISRMVSKLFNIAKTDGERIEILNESIINGWKGIFELKPKSSKSSNPFLDKIKERSSNDIIDIQNNHRND